MKATDYYETSVRQRRPDIRDEWCQRVLAQPVRRQAQANRRISHWALIQEFLGGHYLRVVTLEDGETVHNAYFDRGFRI